MKHTVQLQSILVATIFGAALAGCGGEPSEKDIHAAITKEQQATPELMKGLVPEITGVKKLGCKSDSNQAYICDLQMEARQFGKTSTAVAPVRFVKTSDGWAITK